MGSLKPGATYIYERAAGITYAREYGTTDRKIIGMEYPLSKEAVEKQYQEEMLWKDILRKSETNPTLKSALDRAIMIYKLSEEKLI
jgi:hypothetical protein